MAQSLHVTDFEQPSYGPLYIVTKKEGAEFKAVISPVDIRGDAVGLPAKMCQLLNIKINDKVLLTPFEYKKKRGA